MSEKDLPDSNAMIAKQCGVLLHEVGLTDSRTSLKIGQILGPSS